MIYAACIFVEKSITCNYWRKLGLKRELLQYYAYRVQGGLSFLAQYRNA